MADLSLNGLSKHYGDFYAVREVSLTIADGEFLVLLGPSGCGKTTTLRMVAGFIEPSAGHVRLAGQDVTLLPPWKRNAGMVFQSYALFPHMTVAQNVAFGLEMRKLPRADIERRVEEALALVRLGGYGGRLPRQLSGGQQQRVALARALAIRPDVLLLDEPLSQPRRQAAPGSAGRDPRAAAPARPHHRHGHPRPGRGADHGRPAGGHERGLGAPGRHPARPLRAAGRPLRRGLRRPHHLPRRQPSKRPAASAATAASRSPAPAAVRAAPRCRSGRSGSKSACSRGPDSTTACPVRWNSCRISAP